MREREKLWQIKHARVMRGETTRPTPTHLAPSDLLRTNHLFALRCMLSHVTTPPPPCSAVRKSCGVEFISYNQHKALIHNIAPASARRAPLQRAYGMRSGSERCVRRDRQTLYTTALRGGWRHKDTSEPASLSSTGRRLRGSLGAINAACTYPSSSLAPFSRREGHAATASLSAGVTESRFRGRLTAAKDTDSRYSEGALPGMGVCTSTTAVCPTGDYRDATGIDKLAHPYGARKAPSSLSASLFRVSGSTAGCSGELHPVPPKDASSMHASGSSLESRTANEISDTEGESNSSSERGAPASPNCDKCDGPHVTDRCPHYPKPRENHPDALRRKPPEMGRPCGDVVVRRAQVVRQPGDGSCLFHSLCHGLGGGTASALRRELCSWIKANSDVTIADTPLHDWLWWDSRRTPAAYAASMSLSGWGGGIEMAACSRLKRLNIHVWEQNRLGPGYRRISCFDSPTPATRTINVLYQGGVHYDALVL